MFNFVGLLKPLVDAIARAYEHNVVVVAAGMPVEQARLNKTCRQNRIAFFAASSFARSSASGTSPSASSSSDMTLARKRYARILPGPIALRSTLVNSLF